MLELLDGGQRLSLLHKATLRNDYVSLLSSCLAGGRFLVTLDERHGGNGDNCLVIYDFARNMSVARRLEDFLPVDVREALHPKKHFEGTKWFGSCGWFDATRMVYYTCEPEECRVDELPFVTVDLRGLSVDVGTPPARFDDHVLRDEYGNDQAVSWSWSMGTGQEPGWNQKSALPEFLKGVVAEWVTPEVLKSLSADKRTMYFRRVAATGDYVRCPAEQWVDRVEEGEKK